MTKSTKIKSATRRVQTKESKSKRFWTRVWNIICWPFRQLAKLCRKIWQWICGINLIGLANLALLIAIIVLFSMLIMDFIGCRRQDIVVVAPTTPAVEQVTVTPKSARVVNRTVLPIKTNAQTRQKEQPSINVVPVNRAEVAIAKQQTATKDNTFWGDVIIDTRAAGAMLQNGATVNGNLYLQDMRKYTLPCGIRINGNLFLRDVNMLQFCGEFIITGNIYVSPRSSFGPIPKTARLGGNVIL